MYWDVFFLYRLFLILMFLSNSDVTCTKCVCTYDMGVYSHFSIHFHFRYSLTQSDYVIPGFYCPTGFMRFSCLCVFLPSPFKNITNIGQPFILHYPCLTPDISVCQSPVQEYGRGWWICETPSNELERLGQSGRHLVSPKFLIYAIYWWY